MPEKVLVLRVCANDMTSYGGFLWPKSGYVEAPDWSPDAECGHGLHGWLWGEGESKCCLYRACSGIHWLVVEVDADSVVDLGGKVKFPRGNVVFCGDQDGAVAFIRSHSSMCRRIIGTREIGPVCVGGGLTEAEALICVSGRESKLSGPACSTFVCGNDSRVKVDHGSFVSGGSCSIVQAGDCSQVHSKGGYSQVECGEFSSVIGWTCLTARAGKCSTLVGEQCCCLSGGENSVLIGGNGTWFSGGLGSLFIAYAMVNGTRYFQSSIRVDGVNIRANVTYEYIDNRWRRA